MKTHKIDLDAGKNVKLAAEARRLLAGGADPGDRIEGWRGDMLCLSGNVGALADRSLRESDSGLPTFAWVKYRAFDVVFTDA